MAATHKVSMGSVYRGSWAWQPPEEKPKSEKRWRIAHNQLCQLKSGRVVYRDVRVYSTPNGEHGRVGGALFRPKVVGHTRLWVQAGCRAPAFFS